MEFVLLGPVELRIDGRKVALGGPKPRALLAILLLNANQVVPRDRVLEALWGERQPPAAARSLDSYVSRLRGLIGSDRLVRRAPGYLLRVEPGELDLERFRGMVEEARSRSAAGHAADAAATLRAALALWRGPALADLLYEPVASPHSERLEELRLSATEERIDADLACGGGPELVSELEGLVRDHPLRERLLGQLMLALYRAGRQAEALSRLQTSRQHLAEELGLQPGPALGDLERRILRHDPGLDAVRPPRGRLPRRPSRVVATTAVAGLMLAALAAIGLGLAHRGAPAAAGGATHQLLSVDAGSGRLTEADALPGPAADVAVGHGSVWIADPAEGMVLRVDPASRRVVDRISVEGQPVSVASGSGAVWVASTLSGTVARIDPVTDEVTQTIRLGGAAATDISFGPAGLWVADSTDRALIHLDEDTGEATRTISLDIDPAALVVGAHAIWVADHDAGVVAQVDLASGGTLATVHVGGGPVALAGSPAAVWVANSLDATVSRIDPATGVVVATIPVGGDPSGIALADGSVWVATQHGGAVSRIDATANRVTASIATNGQPTAVAAAGGTVWVGAGPSPDSHRGGTLNLVTTNRFASIDPAFQTLAGPNQFGKLAYDSLVTLPASAGAAGLRLVPDLAVALPTPTNGGTTYAFRLRRGVRYSDGRPLRAGDFRRAVERLFRVGSQGADNFSGVLGGDACARRRAGCDLSAGIRTDDSAGTVVFQLAAPDPDFLFKLTPYAYAAPIPAGVPDRDVGATPAPGTGPYRILDWRGGEIRFARNPYFREWSHPAQPDGNPDAIVWRFVPSFEAAAKAVEEGRADWIFGLLPPSQLRRLRIERAAQLHESASFYVDFIPLNTHRPPFDDVRVRRALNLAIDRARIVRMYGGAVAAGPQCQPLPPGMLGYRRYCPYTRRPGGDGAWRAPDLGRARRLVAASGTAGTRIDVWGTTDVLGVPRGLPAYVASLLRSLGYRTRLHLAPLSSIGYAMRSRFQLSVDGDWAPDFPMPSALLPKFFGCRGGYSNGYVCDPALDRKMRRASLLQLRDPQRAAALWAEIDHDIVDRAYWVPTVNSHGPELVSARLRNYQYNPIWDFIADQVWLR